MPALASLCILQGGVAFMVFILALLAAAQPASPGGASGITAANLLISAALTQVAATPEPATRARMEGGGVAALLSDDDYPKAAIDAEEQGTVGFAVAVGSDGKATGCRVTRSSGSTTLDQATCRIVLERAKFQPARDQQGKAVADLVKGRIMWRLPPPPKLQRFGYEATFDRAGKVIDCKPFAIFDDGEAAETPKTTDKGCATAAMANYAPLIAMSQKPTPTLVLEGEIVRDPAQGLNEPLADRLLLRVVMRLSIGEGGKVLRCEVIDTRGPVTGEPCQQAATATVNFHNEQGDFTFAQSVFLRGEGQP